MFGYVLLCTLPHIFSSFLLLTSNSKFFEEGAGEFENTVFFCTWSLLHDINYCNYCALY